VPRLTGRRIIRGHTFIGGCERTDIDILIREAPDHTFDVEVAYGTRRAVEALFGPIPRTATVVPDSVQDRYQGDPSIGRVR